MCEIPVEMQSDQTARHDAANRGDVRTVTYLAHAYTVLTVLRMLKGKGSPYSITERKVPELIPVLGSQPAGDVSHEPGGRLTLLSVRPAVTPATLKRAVSSFAAG